MNNLIRDLRYALAFVRQESRIHAGGDVVSRDRHRREHCRSSASRARCSAAPASVQGREPPRDPVESLARPGDHAGLVFHGAVFRHQERTSGFEHVAIAFGTNYNLTGNGEPERIGTIRISSNLLPMLGYRAAMGRLFLAEEDAAGRDAHRASELRHVDAPVRLRPAHARARRSRSMDCRTKSSASCRNLFRFRAK